MKGVQNSNSYSTNSNWLNLKLKNPIILGSMTLVSHSNIADHVGFYKKAEKHGVSAIILESFIPVEYGDYENKKVANTIRFFNNSLSGNSDRLGFSLLGPPFPNISSIRYGLNLFKKVKSELKIPVICSLINLGSEEFFINWAKVLISEGVDALEFNFSCPNVISTDNELLSVIPLTDKFLRKLNREIDIPFTIKTDPYFSKVDSTLIGNIKNLTFSNAHIGLHPPSLNKPFSSKFGQPEWSYSGIYGAFNPLLTYRNLAKLKTEYPQLIVSVSGGLMNENNLIEALLLGADTIQLSSVIMFKGLKVIESMVDRLNNFMMLNSFTSIDEFRGESLKYIQSEVSEIDILKKGIVLQTIKNKPKVKVTSSCINCMDCIDRGCVAIKVSKNNSVYIDNTLCSYCGLCQNICKIDGALISY